VRVRIATREDIPALVRTLAAAFADDPLQRWMVPERGYATRSALLFPYLLRYAVSQGAVYTVTGESEVDRAAVAVWLPPGRWRTPFWALVREVGSLVRAGGLRTARMVRRLADVERLHPVEPPHWYLQILGTAPVVQGRGLGSALLAATLARWDDQGLPCYLESSNPRNLPLYLRHGFRIRREVTFRHGPPQWLLWRDAADPRD
jgi:GNAT superfamily N-acetyltransferase